MRTDQISIRTNPKTKYLAQLAAKAQGRTLSEFVEWAVQEALYAVAVDDHAIMVESFAEVGDMLWRNRHGSN